MNGTQVTIAVGYGVLVLATVVFVVTVVRSTSARERRKGFDFEAAAERENRSGWLITGLPVALAVIVVTGPEIDQVAEYVAAASGP